VSPSCWHRDGIGAVHGDLSRACEGSSGGLQGLAGLDGGGLDDGGTGLKRAFGVYRVLCRLCAVLAVHDN